MAGSWGFACADGPLEGEVLMLSAPADLGSLWTVSGADGAAHVYRYAGNHFDYVGETSASTDPE